MHFDEIQFKYLEPCTYAKNSILCYSYHHIRWENYSYDNKNDNILITQTFSQLFIIHARLSKHQEIFIRVISNSRQFYHTVWLVTQNGYAEITHKFKYTCTT